jgi:hypothetical protein
VGLLLDRAGVDVYAADSSGRAVFDFLQGAAEGVRDLHAGGLGLLIDASGNDRYRAEDWAQGVGVDGGLGVLVDLRGKDRYRASSGSQGSGHRRGMGLLLEGSGDDRFEVLSASGRSLGFGFDLGTGMILDAGGADHYRVAGHALGASLRQGAGWFMDLAGEDDYENGGETDLAYALPGSVPPWRTTVPGVVVFLDLEQSPEGFPRLGSWRSPFRPGACFLPGGEGARLGGGILGRGSRRMGEDGREGSP